MKKNEEIICGADNLKTFRSRLRAAVPGFIPVLKALFDAGLVTGLRGARLTVGAQPEQPAPVEIKAAGKECLDCRHWQRDRIGDGLGIGQCRHDMNPGLLKWPRQTACFKFEGK